MDIILVRPETDAGVIAAALNRREAVIDCILATHRADAVDLQARLADPALHIFEIKPTSTADDFRDVAAVDPGLGQRAGVVVLDDSATRLGQLVVEMTGRHTRRLGPGEMVCVRGGTLSDLVAGRGTIHYRYPTVSDDEEPLRSKAQAMMTMASLLAGFVFTGVAGLLVLEPGGLSLLRGLAVALLSTSLFFFVGSVWLYDKLSLPGAVWPQIPWWRDLLDRHEGKFGREGPRYHLMRYVSRWLLVPAGVMAVLGFILMILGIQHTPALVLSLIGLVAAVWLSGGRALIRAK